MFKHMMDNASPNFSEEVSALKNTEFQKLLLYFILTNEKFIPLCEIIPGEVFTEKYLEKFYQRIKYIYAGQKEKKPLGINLAILLQELYGQDIQPSTDIVQDIDYISKQQIIQLLNKFSSSANELAQFEKLVQKKTLMWLKEHTLVSLIRESALEYTQSKDCEASLNIIKKGLNKIQEYEFFFDDKVLPVGLDTDIFYERKNLVKTGFQILDEYLKGGLGEGDFGLFATKSGGGKTWFLSQLALSAITQNKNVLYVTLELSKGQIFQRIGSLAIRKHIVDKSAFNQVVNLFHTSPEFQGKLFIVEKPPMTLSTQGISNILNMIKRERGLKIDTVLIDYADYLSLHQHNSNNMNEGDDWKRLIKIFVQLKQLAKAEEVSIWTVSQTNRESRHKDIVDADGFSGSYMKNAIVDVSLSYSSDKNSLYVIKNRFGEDNIVLSMLLNKNIPEILIY